jgi:transcriptional regulator with XRE-family HTH domain
MSSGFGVALRTARARRGLSQEQLADAAGVHRAVISLYERDQQTPGLDVLVLLSRALGVSPAEMMAWYEPALRPCARGGRGHGGRPGAKWTRAGPHTQSRPLDVTGGDSLPRGSPPAWATPDLREPRYSQGLERGLAILGCFKPSRPVLGSRISPTSSA